MPSPGINVTVRGLASSTEGTYVINERTCIQLGVKARSPGILPALSHRLVPGLLSGILIFGLGGTLAYLTGSEGSALFSLKWGDQTG